MRSVLACGPTVVLVTLLLALCATACQVDDPGSAETSAPTANRTGGDEPTVTPPAATPAPTPEATVPATTVSPDTAAPAPTATPVAESTPTPAPASIDQLVDMSSLADADCPDGAQDAQVTCWLATVPLDAANPQRDQMVELMLAYVDNGDPRGVGPVVFLQGGPGIGSVQLAAGFVGGPHDAYFVDQRGTGFSTPKLVCPEVAANWQRRLTDDDAARIDDDEDTSAYAACSRRLRADGIAFDSFNTSAAATDIEIIRHLLDEVPWNLWGISYGTRIGLAVMRDHPQGVRSAVLDSVVPFEVDFFATIPENGWAAMMALGEACDSDQCAADHGDFLENLSALVLRLNDEPVAIAATRSVTGEQFMFRVDGEALLDMVFTQLYSTRALRALPRQIARPDSGGLDEIVANYVLRRDPNSFDLSTGLYYTTWCREEFPFHDSTADDQLLDELSDQFGDAIADSLSTEGVDEICALFEVAASPAIDDQPLSSSIPTLVFAGRFDPITPPAWSRQVADALPNSTYVEMSTHGHGMTGLCTTSLRMAFLAAPGDALDLTCVSQAGAPDFE